MTDMDSRWWAGLALAEPGGWSGRPSETPREGKGFRRARRCPESGLGAQGRGHSALGGAQPGSMKWMGWLPVNLDLSSTSHVTPSVLR